MRQHLLNYIWSCWLQTKPKQLFCDFVGWIFFLETDKFIFQPSHCSCCCSAWTILTEVSKYITSAPPSDSVFHLLIYFWSLIGLRPYRVHVLHRVDLSCFVHLDGISSAASAFADQSHRPLHHGESCTVLSVPSKKISTLWCAALWSVLFLKWEGSAASPSFSPTTPTSMNSTWT